MTYSTKVPEWHREPDRTGIPPVNRSVEKLFSITPSPPTFPPATDMTDNPETDSDAPTWRILDAALNRANEGLRVVEDYTRMVLDDRHLTSLLKNLRHELSNSAKNFSSGQLVAHRDTRSDVGTAIGTDSEYQRDGTVSIAQANLARVQQSLRTIEEYSKTVAPQVAPLVEQLRYRTYTLEKAIVTAMLSHQSLRHARLCILVDGLDTAEKFQKLVRQIIDAQADIIQLRDKSLDDRLLLGRGKILTECCTGTGTRWIMNDRSDIALAASAHGVHLGQDDLPVAAARRILGPTKIIGVSTHSIEQAREAVLDGANYIGVGPVFPGQTKSFDQYVGVDLVRAVAEEISLPAFAIGGITAENIDGILTNGMKRVAVSGFVRKSADPSSAITALKQRLAENSLT